MHLNKAQRLVRLVQLVARPGGIGGDEVRQRLDIDERTLRRYLADLRDIGIPFMDQGRGQTRRLWMDPTWRRTGIQLTLSEILSLHFGRRLFGFLEGTQFTSDLDGALERLEPAVSRTHADLARQLDRKFVAVPEPSKDYSQMADVIDALVTALVYDNPVTARYTKPSGRRRGYELEPLTLATYRQGLYLFARDRADGRVKTFAVERFDEVERLRHEHIEVPEGYDPADVVRHAFGIISGDPCEVVAAFDASVGHYVRERCWHRSQVLEDLPGGGVRCRLRVALTEELVSWLLGFGGKVVVEAPRVLAERLAAEHRRALERRVPARRRGGS